MNVRLIEGIDEKFFLLLDALYKPMLSREHLKDKYKFTIYLENSDIPVGIISINKGENYFMQFALIPEVRNKGIAQKALSKLVDIVQAKRVDWGCKRINYPSLKILHDLGGGLFDNVVKNRARKSFEGFYKPIGKVSEGMRRNLASVLDDSKEIYREWLSNEYSSRHSQQRDLRKYLLSHVKIVDSHYHFYKKEFIINRNDDLVQMLIRKEPTEESILLEMNESKVARTVIFGLPTINIDLSKLNNHILAISQTSKYRDYFIPFAVLEDDIDIDLMVQQNIKGFKEHVYGLRIQRDEFGRSTLASKKRIDLYKKISEYKMPVIFHFGDNLVERVRDIVNLVPELKMIIAHLGGMFPKIQWIKIQSVLNALKDNHNVFFDISAIKSKEIILNAYLLLGSEKLIWGSDSPYEIQKESISRLLSIPEIGIFDLEKILSKNILRMLIL